ncbi:hypothetical protein Tco_1434225 [Tanacetum coccineum]
MESSSLNSEERELQQMQLEERQLHSNCMARFKELKTHLEFLHNINNLLEIEKWLNEKEIHQQESLVTESTTLEANLSTNGTTSDDSSVTEGIAMDASLVSKQSTIDYSTSSA